MVLYSCNNGLQLQPLDGGQEEEEMDQGQLQAWDLLSCHVACMVATSACELGIPDLLAESGGGGLTAQQIADKLGRQAPRHAAELDRMMRLLCAKGVFACHLEDGGGPTRYELAPASTWLRRQADSRQLSVSPFLLLEMSMERLAPWRHLASYILDGGPTPFEAAHGPNMDVYAYTRANPEFSHRFHAAMACSTDISLAAFLDHYTGLDDVRVLVDVAGGVGTAVSRIVARHSHIKGINYDLPHVVAAAPSLPGVDHVGGDMFESIPSADAIFMKWVLPNWDDENCIKLLQNCQKALQKGGKLILLDPMIDLNIMKKQVSILNTNRMAFDVAMIAQTKGRARTQEEIERLLQVSGFQHTNFFEIPCQECIVEAS